MATSRPSGNVCDDTNPDFTGDHAVIGDTASSIFHILKLLRSCADDIYLYTEGNDSTNMPHVDSTCFAAINAKTIIEHMIHDKIKYTRTSGKSLDCVSDETYICQLPEDLRKIVLRYISKKTVSYFSGSGPLGNFISAYHIPHFGPWFPRSLPNSDSIETFVRRYARTYDLNPTESVLATRLSEMWSIPKTDRVTVKRPSILCKHHVLKKRGACRGEERQLFKEVYQYVISKSNVHVKDNSDTLYFCPNNDGTYDVTTKMRTIPNLNVTFKTNPYTALRIGAVGGYPVCPLRVPVFYRACLPITAQAGRLVGTLQTDGTLPTATYGPVTYPPLPVPSCNSCSSTSTRDRCGPNHLIDDYILVHNNFSLYDVTHNIPQESGNLRSMVWTGSTYVTKEDFHEVDQQGWFGSNGVYLLIVEAVNFKHRRTASYNTEEDYVDLRYANIQTELKYLRQFARIVSDIYLAHTGDRVIPDSLLAIETFTLPTGQSMESNLIKNYSQRDSPMTSILELIAGIYGEDYYKMSS